MKKLISSVTVLFVTSLTLAVAAPSNEEMMAKEKAAWQAFKDKNEEAFKKVVDHDMVAVYADKISDMTKEMADMKAADIKSFEISDFKSRSDEKDVVVTTYKVKLEGSVGGQDISGTHNAGSVWKMENGQWLAIFHTNIKAEPAK